MASSMAGGRRRRASAPRPLLLAALGLAAAGLVAGGGFGTNFVNAAAQSWRRGLGATAAQAERQEVGAFAPAAADPQRSEQGVRPTALLSAGLAAVLLLFGSVGSVEAKQVRNFPAEVIPPRPSRDPKIYALQVKSWAMEPIFRSRLYLQAMKQRLSMDTWGVFSARNFVHWGSDGDNWWKYDVLDGDAMRQVVEEGKVLLDSDMTDRGNELTVYIYASDKDREAVQKTANILDLVEVPDDLKEFIKKCRETPIGPYPGPFPDKVLQQGTMVPSILPKF